MPKFSTHVALMDPGFKPANFAPGDEVPEWAIDQVGEHVLVPETQDAPADIPDFVGATEATSNDDPQDTDSKDDAPAEGHDDSEAVDEDPEASDVPDFTAPAPARRGRSRKQ